MVLMNHGDGTFAPPSNLAAGAGAADVEIADFNNDGKQDLVIANLGSINLALGNGDGTFQSARPYAAGFYPSRVSIGDFNHDGNLDIVALNYSYSSLGAQSVLMGNGDGSFKPPTAYNLGASPNDVQAADFNGNVATGYTGTLAIKTNDIQAAMLSTYTFTAADAGVHTFSVTLKTSGGTTFAVQDVANATNLAFNYSQHDILVTPAALAGIAITAPSNVTAGVAFNVKVSAVDAFGNTVLGYLGKVHFSGPSGVPLDYTFTAADAGSHTFSVTLTSTGTQTLGVADTVTGSLKAQVSVVVKTAATGGTGGGKKIVV